mmetsp:Transcript_45339/g.135303  ORF Transcript_45339/g.135303 Transcript_45339/m.135303 type:complete len:161 (-) Transcript_45339:578-1060(-)|eukprot:356956-Chlamydomonas_euryale.AAC.4
MDSARATAEATYALSLVPHPYVPPPQVFIMQRSCSRPLGNVFEAASRSWERRQEAIAAELNPKPRVDFGFWGSGSLQREEREAQRGAAWGEQEEGGPGVRGREGRRVAGLAVDAAKAAQLWRAYLRSRSALRSVSDGSSGSSSNNVGNGSSGGDNVKRAL